MMAGQARQIALRKLEVAVLSHGAFQAQRNGFCALLSDVLACYLSFTHASRLQDFIQIGRTSTSITASQAINLNSHHLTILRTSSLTIRENPRKRLGVGQLQILSPVVDSLSNRVNGCCWAVCETAAKLTSCRAAISPLRLCRVWMRPDLTGMLVRLHASKTFVSSRKSRCPPPATRRPP